MEGSCKQHTPYVTTQKYESHCHLLAMADMTGTVLRMSGTNVYLSCMPMVDGRVSSVNQSIAYCTRQDLGLETKETYPYERIGRGIPNFGQEHYQRVQWRQRYRISDIEKVFDETRIKTKLMTNFGEDGPSFPCVGILRMGELLDGEYARLCSVNNDPYNHHTKPSDTKHAIELYGPEHSVLIVGINTLSEKPYCEIKNTHGEEWGDGGFSKVAFEVFNCVLFPTL